MRRSKKRFTLSIAQLDAIGQFNDYAFEYPHLTFDEVAKMVLGSRPFPSTPAGSKFKQEAKAVFDRERAK
jgi:hypothetical protein